MQENSFTLLSKFSQRAKKAGYSDFTIGEIFKRATASDRENLEEVLFEELVELEYAETKLKKA